LHRTVETCCCLAPLHEQRTPRRPFRSPLLRPAAGAIVGPRAGGAVACGSPGTLWPDAPVGNDSGDRKGPVALGDRDAVDVLRSGARLSDPRPSVGSARRPFERRRRNLVRGRYAIASRAVAADGAGAGSSIHLSRPSGSSPRRTPDLDVVSPCRSAGTQNEDPTGGLGRPPS
jgi:hypothetical protein